MAKWSKSTVAPATRSPFRSTSIPCCRSTWKTRFWAKWPEIPLWQRARNEVRASPNPGSSLSALRHERPRKLLQDKEPAGWRGHIGRRDPGRRGRGECHPYAESLPHHAAAKRAIAPADDTVGPEKQAWADRAGACLAEHGATLYTRV